MSGKVLTQAEWDSVWDVLELAALRAVNDREWMEMVHNNQHIFTPEFLEMRAKQGGKHV